jgi:hypothetical protein
MKNWQRINNRIAFTAGSALALAIGGTSAFGAVVISDGFGDADRNNDGVVDRFDLDISANGTVDAYEAPLYPGSSINEANVAEDPLDVGIAWFGARGWTSSPGSVSGEYDAKFHARIINDAAGATPEGVNIDSGLALSLNSKGRGASVTGFFGQNVALGPNIGDQVKVSFDMRFWLDSPNENVDGTPGDEKGDLRWGIFQDTDNQIGTVSPFAGAPDVNTGIPTPAVWGEADGLFQGDLGSAGANGDAGWYTRIKTFADVPQDGADDASGGPRIYEEVNGSSAAFLGGSDNDFVVAPDDVNPNFTALLFGKVYNLSLTLERTEFSIYATYTVHNITDGTTFSFGGEESLNDGSIPGSGGIQSDNWDYFAIRNSSSSSAGEDDYDMIIDNFLVEVIAAASQLEGDLNGDGFVGIADLNIVLGAWNQNVSAGDPLAGDPSGDGFVGIADLNVVLGNWNAGTPPSANAVPEPATLALIGLGGLAMLKRRR